MMRLTRLVSIPSFLLLLVACTPSMESVDDSIDDGYSALSSSQYQDAREHFEVALEQIDSTHPSYRSAKLGKLQALAHEDSAAVAQEFSLDSAAAGFDADDHCMLVSELVSVANGQASRSATSATNSDQSTPEMQEALATIEVAVGILEAGKQSFPEYEKWNALIRKVGDKAHSYGNPEALASSLANLGYLGEDVEEDDDARD